MTASPYTLSAQLKAAKNGLEDAQITLCGAVTVHAEAKRALDLAEAHKLTEGVEGKNEKERAAKLRLEQEVEYTALCEAEDALSESRCAFELTRLEWELSRQQVKLLQVAA